MAAIPVTELPELKALLATMPWRFAKTYATTAPHEYMVRGPVTEVAFCQLHAAIEAHGVNLKFGPYRGRYLNLGDGWKYWHMGKSLSWNRTLNRDRVLDPDLWPPPAALAGPAPPR